MLPSSGPSARSSRRRVTGPAGTAAALALLLLAAGSARAGQVCLPPLFDGGRRLVAPDDTRVFWLEPLLRQHEACWRPPASAREARVFVYGSSGIFGYPYAAEETAVEVVNRSLAAERVPAHLFNLGMMWTGVPRDALIVRESERYRPDVIVYAVTLDDFFHRAPSGYSPIDTFFKSNRRAVDRIVKEKIPSMTEPFELYELAWQRDPSANASWRTLRQAGSLLRASVRQAALGVRRAWFPEFAGEPLPVEAPAAYDCELVRGLFGFWKNWRDWSLLPYLASLQKERGIDVLVVNWPVAPNPSGECFNARYPARDFDEYNAWLRAETAAKGLRLLDLHDQLAPADFLDSFHPTAGGQRIVAARIDAALREILARRSGN